MKQDRKTRRAFARFTIALTAALLLSPLAASAAAKKPAEKPAPAIELGTPFGDNAVLQRDVEVPVWGWSKPGTTVTVESAGQKENAKAGAIPTFACNWCVSPLTPMAVAGVIWVPGNANLGYTPAEYSAELEIYARSLPATYGQDQVQFLYAQPSATLVKGITTPSIRNGKAVTFDAWPKSPKSIAAEMVKAAK